MYLKSIEIQGFKSFANRILFEFHNGITGIVGPNGSGKSNVADAVRWVLGEQRVKQLRGGSMQDVIFAGTEMRKPQGFAFVAITLDNSDHQLAIDYDEVTVSRRLYRSGESEYRINGSACRLKDINELFYDTGIGKEGYSIIGQGQIDKILSGKPEERRELFDEAAGIVKFKRRKALSQKKLDDERQNLVRVSDILAELEKQVGPLAKQSEAARKYLNLKEELKTYDVNLFLIESETLRAQIGEVEAKESIVSGDLADTRRQAEEIRLEYEQLEEEIADLDAGIAEKRALLGQAEMRSNSLEGQINVLKEQINTERMNAEHFRSRVDSVSEEIARRKTQIEAWQSDHEGTAEAAVRSQKKQDEAEAALRSQDESIMLLDSRIEEAKAGIIATLNEKASLTAREQRYEAMLEQIQVRRAEVAQKRLRMQTDETTQEEQLRKEQEKLEQLETHMNELAFAQTECEDRVAGLEEETRRLTVSLGEQEREYRTVSARLESLRNLAERYEGYGGSIRKVMEVRDRVRGICGVVADLITTEKKYETAIETALGGSIQNVVTDTEQTAKTLIEYLKRNRYGRATFLPLTSVGQGTPFRQREALAEPGVIGLASELVHVEERYQGLACYLLGRVVVVDTIDHAIALARKYKHSLRIVTPEGELFAPGGSMTGGTFKNSSNLLGRRRELEELERTCEKSRKSSEAIQQTLREKEAFLSEEREKLEQIREERHQASLDQNTQQMNVNQLEEKQEGIRESSLDLETEHAQLEEQIREIERNRQTLKTDADELTQTSEQTTKRIEEMSTQMEEARRVREESAHELETIRLETAGLRQTVDFALQNIRRVREEINRLEEELAGLEVEKTDSGEAIEAKQREIAALREQVAAATRDGETLHGELEEKTAQKEEKANRQKEFFRRRDALSERGNSLDKELFRLQNQKEKLEEKQENQVNYMWSEYELTYNTAEPLRNPELTSLPDIRRQIDERKKAIRALGNVNVNAIEDYKEISDRYTFMKSQHDDLVEAETDLRKIIEELDTGMRRQFEEKFREIRAEFDRVFRELFGGGHGTLSLQEDEDILEAGIQIIAQPPGKKLQNMMQLSGGEKALTAISLLFAIQNLKPSPFCLLDEIEAALDDSNVDRFAKYLSKLTANTQFIVITHRRGTIMASDRLYGITMQEKGVSTLVSVSLIEDQLEK